MSQEEHPECPLCMEALEVDDLNFFPCTCGYQICRFCWHRIRTDENGLCPACRKAYPENPADFKPLSQEQVAKLKAEKRHKEQQKKQKATEGRKHLANVRVVQKNLVFVVGLPMRLAETQVLKRPEYFGRFGKIHKVVINQSGGYTGPTGPSASAYVTYHRCEDALRAIQAVNNVSVENRILKTSLGTTKYCSHFIKTQPCPKPDCMYLHDFGDPEASFTKEEMQQGKHQEYEKKLHEQLTLLGTLERKSPPSGVVNGAANGGSGGVGWPTLVVTNGEGVNGVAPTQAAPIIPTTADATEPLKPNHTNSLTNNNRTKTKSGKDSSNKVASNNDNSSCTLNNNNNMNNARKKSAKTNSIKEGTAVPIQSETCVKTAAVENQQTTTSTITESTTVYEITNGFHSDSSSIDGLQSERKNSLESLNGDLEPVPDRTQQEQNEDEGVDEQPWEDGDDDLGFDPFQEGKKIMGDLLEKEIQLQQENLAAMSIQQQNQLQQLQQLQHQMTQTAPGFPPTLDQQLYRTTGFPQLPSYLPHSLQQRLLNRTVPPPGFAHPQPPISPTPAQPATVSAPPPGLYMRTGASPPGLFRGSESNGSTGGYVNGLVNGTSKVSEWPESLRALIQDSAHQPTNHNSPNYSNHTNKGLGFPGTLAGVGAPGSNFPDWTALDPAILSSRPQNFTLPQQPQHPLNSYYGNQPISLANLTNLGGISDLSINELNGFNSLSALGGLNGITQNNWTHHMLKSQIMQNSVPPPGFSLRHPKLKPTISSGIDAME